MKIDILTLFPDFFDNFTTSSIIGRAVNDSAVDINLVDIREFAPGKHKQVDDTPYGGGAGMVLMIEPIYEALQSVRGDDSFVILLTPQGEVYNQEKAMELSHKKHIILICGHYEGFDERIRELVDIELSIGDYVLTGGEIPAMVITDSIVRLLENVIKKESHEYDSFTNNLLDYPTYTKPSEFRGMIVPEVLLSGHHANIEEYRKEEQIKRTKKRRPDLIEKS